MNASNEYHRVITPKRVSVPNEFLCAQPNLAAVERLLAESLLREAGLCFALDPYTGLLHVTAHDCGDEPLQVVTDVSILPPLALLAVRLYSKHLEVKSRAAPASDAEAFAAMTSVLAGDALQYRERIKGRAFA